MISAPRAALAAALDRWASRNDLVLAGAIVSVIFLMILPLPTWALDGLIAVNISAAVTLLAVAIYLPSPLAFSSFPAVLLVTTVFRLSISIATTRQVLLEADAGHIVSTFGKFVVGGNLVVGLVVFLILTIVQFLVITKGAERVAEVSARFSLDGMPGKQMSIDGDMRAGAIDMDEARRRRLVVERESQLYGAMDGAMKFVKGDAIAGITIVVVNLVGGILIGTLQRGLSISQATHIYSILTIGDGLVAQIPALLISIAAGLVVTRVSSDSQSNVGREVAAQIMAQPKALSIAAAIMLGFAAIPGMPAGTFLGLAALGGALGFILAQPGASRAPGPPSPARGERGSASEVRPIQPPIPLLMELAPDVDADLTTAQVSRQLERVSAAFQQELGLAVPRAEVRQNEALGPGSFAVLIGEVPVALHQVDRDGLLVPETEEQLSLLGIPFERLSVHPLHPGGLWVSKSHASLLSGAGLAFLSPVEAIGSAFDGVLRRNAAEFVGIQESRALLAGLEQQYPDLVKEVLRIMPIQKMSEVLQRLVSESIPIRNLRAVMEALVEWGQREKDTLLLTEYVRVALRKTICHRHTRQGGQLPAYLLCKEFEDEIRDSIRQTSAGSYLALETSASKRMMEAIRSCVGPAPPAGRTAVMLVPMDIRRYLRKLIEQEMEDLPVLSFQELTPDVQVQPLARVT